MVIRNINILFTILITVACSYGQSKTNIIVELNKPMSEFLMSINKEGEFDYIDINECDSLVLHNDDTKTFLYIENNNVYDTLAITLSSEDKVSSINATSLNANRRVSYNYSDNYIHEIIISDLEGKNRTLYSFGFKGRISYEIIEDDIGCELFRIDYFTSRKGQIYSIEVYDNCAVLSIYVFNRRGRLLNILVRGRKHAKYSNNKFGFTLKNGEFIQTNPKNGS